MRAAAPASGGASTGTRGFAGVYHAVTNGGPPHGPWAASVGCRSGRVPDRGGGVVHHVVALGRRRIANATPDHGRGVGTVEIAGRCARAGREGDTDRRRLPHRPHRAVVRGRRVHGQRRWHGRSPSHTETRSRVRPGMVARGGADRVPGLAARHQPGRRDLRGARRRHGREEPHEGPGERLGAGLVPRRPDDRVQLRSRRAADGRVPDGPRRISSPSDPDGRLCRVPGMVAGRNAHRLHGRDERASTTSGSWIRTART